MNTSQETTNLMKAMISAAPELSAVTKNKQAYGYKYATLDSVLEMLRNVLPKHGLWFTQMPTREGEKSTLTTRVFHETGEWIEDSIEMTDTELQGKANDTQRLGASITYFRRYALSTIFGIASDEDVDGNVNLKQQPKAAPRQQPVQSQPVQQPSVQTTQPMPPRTPEAEEAEKQAKAAQYLNDNFARRVRNGETQQSILADYANLLKTDQQRRVDELPPQEVRVVARALAERNLNRQKSQQQ